MVLAQAGHQDLAMSTILVRCTVHPAMSHRTFEDWFQRRREELTGAPDGLRRVDAFRLDDHDWVVELVSTSHAGDTAVRHFVADLRLLGLRPSVYGGDRRDTTVASRDRRMS